jgi:hypothetical protein
MIEASLVSIAVRRVRRRRRADRSSRISLTAPVRRLPNVGSLADHMSRPASRKRAARLLEHMTASQTREHFFTNTEHSSIKELDEFERYL